MCKRMFVVTLTIGLFGSMLIQPALGKEYPIKPITIISREPPGGSIDILTRVVADIAPKYLGQPMVVANKPGASGSTAVGAVIASKPDGYTLMVNSSNYLAITVLTQKIPFDPSFLVPIASFMEFRHGFVVRSDAPWKTFVQFLDYGKKNPGKLRWCHVGRGGTEYLRTLLIFKKAGVEAIDVPYKGSPEKLVALLGGHVDGEVTVYGGVSSQVKAGKVRFLVFYNDRGYEDHPDVPNAKDLGFPDVAKFTQLVGIYAHKDTPGEIKKVLLSAFKKTYDDPEFKKRIDELGEAPRFEGPEATMDVIKEGEEIGVPLIKELGLYIEK